MAEYKEQFGKLPVLLVRMNPDLAMGGDLLKKTGSDNLFMVFGEPDTDVRTGGDGKVTVEVLKVYGLFGALTLANAMSGPASETTVTD